MRISARRCVVDFNRKYNRLTGQNTGELRLEQKLSLLNEAMNDYFVSKVKLFEVDSSARTILNPLEYKHKAMQKKKSNRRFDIFKLEKEHYRVVRRNVIIYKEGCGEKELQPLIYQSDDLNSARKSPYWKSSYEWENVLADEGNEGLFIWHDQQFEIKDVFVDYIKHPQELHAASLHEDGSYLDWNNITRTEDTDLQLGGYAYNDITNLAVFYHMAEIGDTRDMQTNIQKILSTEKLIKN